MYLPKYADLFITYAYISFYCHVPGIRVARMQAYHYSLKTKLAEQIGVHSY